MPRTPAQRKDERAGQSVQPARSDAHSNRNKAERKGRKLKARRKTLHASAENTVGPSSGQSAIPGSSLGHRDGMPKPETKIPPVNQAEFFRLFGHVMGCELEDFADMNSFVEELTIRLIAFKRASGIDVFNDMSSKAILLAQMPTQFGTWLDDRPFQGLSRSERTRPILCDTTYWDLVSFTKQYSAYNDLFRDQSIWHT